MDCEYGKKIELGDKFCRNCGEAMLEQELFNCECGAEVFKNDRFCHECGAPFSSAGICGCGNALAENARFCHACGKEVFTSEESVEPAEESPEEIMGEIKPDDSAEQKGYYRPNPDGSFTFTKGKQPSSQ